ADHSTLPRSGVGEGYQAEAPITTPAGGPRPLDRASECPLGRVAQLGERLVGGPSTADRATSPFAQGRPCLRRGHRPTRRPSGPPFGSVGPFSAPIHSCS